MTTAEKVAYLKGLIEGAEIDTTTKEGKLLSVVVDILEDLALDVEDLNDQLAEFEDGLDAISDDLADVEDLLFDDEDDEDDEDEDFDDEDEELDPNEITLYEARCPGCGEIVTFEESVLEEGGIVCPGCGEKLEFQLDDEDE